jgi:hypothetical protein
LPLKTAKVSVTTAKARRSFAVEVVFIRDIYNGGFTGSQQTEKVFFSRTQTALSRSDARIFAKTGTGNGAWLIKPNGLPSSSCRTANFSSSG